MFTQKNRDELEVKGYTVVPGVLTEAECDEHIASFRQWLDTFPADTWPQTNHSLINRYRIGHREPAWRVRLSAYPVFCQVWETEKLLTSMDAVAIGRPPEDGKEDFWSPGKSWLHCDQTAEREGLHGYQGAVYLEHCEEGDWTFEVIEGSHNHFDDFHDMRQVLRCKKVTDEDLDWFSSRGCVRGRVTCPKGGIVLWDSRLIHANARPLKGRANPGRWRFCVFVCMTPAAWATPADLEVKANAYNNLILTGHWASTDIHVFGSNLKEGSTEDPSVISELPEIAKSDLAKKLVGLEPYDSDKDDKTTQYVPKFNKEKWSHLLADYNEKY